jgi:hypothetical protein
MQLAAILLTSTVYNLLPHSSTTIDFYLPTQEPKLTKDPYPLLLIHGNNTARKA